MKRFLAVIWFYEEKVGGNRKQYFRKPGTGFWKSYLTEEKRPFIHIYVKHQRSDYLFIF